ISSILSTSSCGEGTHTTSLPDCPTSGVYSTLGAWAKAQTAVAEKIRIDKHRLAERHTDMFLLQLVGVKGKRPATGSFACGTYIAQGGSPPELYSSVTVFLQGLSARIASDILARTALLLMPGKTMEASTPMIMITIMSSTIVNPAWRLLVLRI